MLEEVCGLVSNLHKSIKKLEKALDAAGKKPDSGAKAEGCRDLVVPAMSEVRKAADELENIVAADLWPLPSYAEMLFLK